MYANLLSRFILEIKTFSLNTALTLTLLDIVCLEILFDIVFNSHI